jgi:hypothetical protein
VVPIQFQPSNEYDATRGSPNFRKEERQLNQQLVMFSYLGVHGMCFSIVKSVYEQYSTGQEGEPESTWLQKLPKTESAQITTTISSWMDTVLKQTQPRDDQHRTQAIERFSTMLIPPQDH